MRGRRFVIEIADVPAVDEGMPWPSGFVALCGCDVADQPARQGRQRQREAEDLRGQAFPVCRLEGLPVGGQQAGAACVARQLGDALPERRGQQDAVGGGVVPPGEVCAVARFALAGGKATVDAEGGDRGARRTRNNLAGLARRQRLAAGEQAGGQQDQRQGSQGTNRLIVAASAALPGLVLAASFHAVTASSWRPSIQSTSP